jgi:5S rRNA maturation endonuclease (ribonuclease M5)
MDGVERVLYRLPQISKSQIVWVCEGEKDVENLSLLGIEATCNVGGAGKWLDSYSETLAGKDVVVCGDNDEPGRKHVELVFNSISNISKTVRVVKLPSEIKDVSDYISSFKTTDESRSALLSIIENTHPCVKGKSLPVYSVGEIEDKYRRFVRNMGTNSFSLGKWLPTLGINLRNLVPGELVFVIGDTGSGKTGILQSIAQSALPLPTLIFELELPEELMFERFASMISGMTCDEIERAYQSEDDSLKTLIDSKLPNLCICPISRISVAEMESIIMRTELKLGERPKVVLVDYIQLVKSIGPNRREKISDIAEELKVMAKTTRTIVVVASQISRPQNVDEKWEPSLHSAKESGSIESSCGLLLSAWLDPKLEKTMNIRVLKSTKGGTGTLVCCNFDGSRMKITEKSKISEEDVPKNYAD